MHDRVLDCEEEKKECALVCLKKIPVSILSTRRRMVFGLYADARSNGRLDDVGANGIDVRKESKGSFILLTKKKQATR